NGKDTRGLDVSDGFEQPFGPYDPPDLCGPGQESFTIDGYQETHWCVALSFTWLPAVERTCTVSVRLKKIKGIPGEVFDHAYLLVRDDQTGDTTYYGARSSITANAGVGGVLVGRSGDPNDPLVAFGDATAPVVAQFSDTFKGSCD